MSKKKEDKKPEKEKDTKKKHTKDKKPKEQEEFRERMSFGRAIDIIAGKD